MDFIKLDTSKAAVTVSAELRAAAEASNALLANGQGAGNDFLGWVALPSSIDAEQLAAVNEVADRLRAKAEVIVCIGIGGSYLGAKAVLEAMSNSFALLQRDRKEPIVLFAGQNISEDYTYELLDAVKDRELAVVVISKSGTTTEPAIAFRILKAELERR